MHKNCVSVGAYYCNVHAELFDLLLTKKVDLILQAHDHTYQRSRQLTTGAACPTILLDGFEPGCVASDGENGAYLKGAGAISVIVGTGGAELYEVNPADPEASY